MAKDKKLLLLDEIEYWSSKINDLALNSFYEQSPLSIEEVQDISTYARLIKLDKYNLENDIEKESD